MLFMSSDTAHDHNLEWAITMLLQYEPKFQQKVIDYIDDLRFSVAQKRLSFQDVSVFDDLVDSAFHPSHDDDDGSAFDPGVVRSA